MSDDNIPGIKKIPNTFDWFQGEFWYWPEDDTKLLQVNDWVSDINYMLTKIPTNRRRVCIQAGGACGIWPLYLSKFFELVLTFEPNPVNFACLKKNAENFKYAGKIVCGNFAIGDKLLEREFILRQHDSEKGNAGAWYLSNECGDKCIPDDEENFMVSTAPLDHGVREDVPIDFIQLDVEGYELQTLLGAQRIILDWNPIIAIEEKYLPQYPESKIKEARNYLESIGYKEIGNIHRDYIFSREITYV